MRFTIEAMPVSKSRPRVFQRGRKSYTYDPKYAEKMWTKGELLRQFRQAMENEDKSIQMEASNLACGKEFKVDMYFHLPPAKSDTESQKNAKLWGLVPCDVNLDVDNLAKFYLDCCNQVVFTDDRYISLLEITKMWAKKPKIVIDIMATKKVSVNDKVIGILELFGPDRLMEFLTVVQELFALYDVDEAEDWVASKVGEENAREVRLARTAYLLSIIADMHGKYFQKIQRRFPNFYKDAEKIERQVALAREGKFDVLETERQESARTLLKAPNE